MKSEPSKNLILPKHITGEKKYYLYVHLRNDTNKPFYFGIGTLQRKSYDRALCHHKRNNLWKRVVDKVGGFSIIIYEESDNRDVICEKEIALIRLMGRIDTKTGTLVNMTDGGEGTLGYKRIWTDSQKRRASEIMKNRITKEETKEKRRQNIYASSLVGRKGADSYVAKGVKLYNIDGNLIKEFPTMREVARHLNVTVSSIYGAIKNNFKCQGFVLKYSDYQLQQLVEEQFANIKRKPRIYDSSKNKIVSYGNSSIVMEFSSLRSCGEYFGLHHSKIKDCIENKKSINGNIIEYVY